MSTNYQSLCVQISALMERVPYVVSNLSNAAAAMWQEMEHINWVGFYKRMGDKLVLGPFQGKPACIEIPVGRGVCGTAAQKNAVLRVADVHAFPGHIACDSASRSEIVLPLIVRGAVWGVLDIDSPGLSRFSDEDEAGLRQVAEVLNRMLERTQEQ